MKVSDVHPLNVCHSCGIQRRTSDPPHGGGGGASRWCIDSLLCCSCPSENFRFRLRSASTGRLSIVAFVEPISSSGMACACSLCLGLPAPGIEGA